MKAWLIGLPVEARWIAVTCGAVIALVVVLVFSNAAGVMFGALRDISQHEPRIARMLGYESVAGDLQDAKKETQRRVASFAYLKDDDTNKAGALLQQTLRSSAEDAGLTVVGSQLAVLESDAEADEDLAGPASKFERLSVTLTLDGPPMALDAFLLTVEQHEPMLAVTSIDIQRKRKSRREKRDTFEFLSVRLRIVALRSPL